MSEIKKGDKVMFLKPNYPVFNKEDEEIYSHFKEGAIYVVSKVLRSWLQLNGEDRFYLKEHFRKL